MLPYSRLKVYVTTDITVIQFTMQWVTIKLAYPNHTPHSSFYEIQSLQLKWYHSILSQTQQMQQSKHASTVLYCHFLNDFQEILQAEHV